MSVIEGTLPKYLEFKTFELFRDKLIALIAPYSKEGSKVDIYKQLFLCPADLSRKHNFKLYGVLSPYVCLWRDSALVWNTENKFYGRSVLPRTMEYKTTTGQTKSVIGYFYDLQTTFELFSSSYYRDFRDRVNQDLIDLDRQRYFIYNLKEMFEDSEAILTRVELILEGLTTRDKVGEDNEQRAFELAAKYTLRITLPYTRGFEGLESLQLYLDHNKIYEKELVNEENSISS